jgi:DNA topoisomerase-1
MGSDNYKIPKTENAETLSLDKCLELIESQKDAPKKKGKFTRRK